MIQLARLLLVAPLLGAAPLLAQTAAIAPGDNLVTDGIPPIPAGIAEVARRYGEFRAAAFWDWHPTRREMIIGTRFGDAPQLHRVQLPGGARTQLTFFPDPVSGASYQPTDGRYVVFTKDVGGGEFFQKYRYDVATGDITLLTDGRSRNTGGAWSHKGDRYAYMSTRRNGRDLDLWVMDPSDPRTDRMVLELEGGAYAPLDWSPDGRTILLHQGISVNESHLSLAPHRRRARLLVHVHAVEPGRLLPGSRRREAGAVDRERDRRAQHQRLRRAGADPLVELRRPLHLRLPLQAPGTLQRPAAGHHQHPRGAGGAVPPRVPRPQQLLPERARHRPDSAEHPGLDRPRQDVREAGQRDPTGRRL